MKIQHIIILLFLFVGLPMYGQSPLYDDPYTSVPMANG